MCQNPTTRVVISTRNTKVEISALEVCEKQIVSTCSRCKTKSPPAGMRATGGLNCFRPRLQDSRKYRRTAILSRRRPDWRREIPPAAKQRALLNRYERALL